MKTIIFGLNGTLTDSKCPLDKDMASLLRKLLSSGAYNIAVISGISWKQMHKQFLGSIGTDDAALLNNLYLLPSSGGCLYQLWSKYGWIAKYSEHWSNPDYEKAHKALETMIKNHGLTFDKLWGKQIEDRETQVTFSALGQKAPLEEKSAWDPDAKKRLGLVNSLAKELPTFEVKVAGLTSIDVTLRTASKKHAIDELMKQLRVSKDDVTFVGDCIFDGGNDYVAIDMGLECVKVSSPEDTKKWILEKLLA